MKYTFYILNIFLFFSFNAYTFDYWLPSKVVVTPDGTLTHKLPFSHEGPNSLVGAGGFDTWQSVVGNFNKFKRVIALGPPPNSLDAQKMVKSNDGILRIGKNRHGYRVIQHKDWILGTEFTSNIFGIGNTLPSISLGIAGSYGKKIVTSRYINNLKDEKKLPKPKIPKNKKDLRSWVEEDFLSWTTTKDIAFVAGTEVATIAIGATLIGTSTFIMVVEKLNKSDAPFDVAVTIEKVKGKGWDFNASIGALGTAYGKMFEKAKNWTYYFDLDAKRKAKIELIPYKGFKKWKKSVQLKLNAEEIYKEMLSGNIAPANFVGKLSKKNQTLYGVMPIEETTMAVKTKSISIAAGIPFLINGSYSKGKSFSISHTKKLNEKSIGTTLLGVYNKESETGGWLSHNKQRTRMFSGNYQKIAPINPNSNESIKRRYSGSYKYFYTRNKANGKRLKKELKYLERKVGLAKELRLKAPNKIKLGTIQIEMDVRISDLATNTLIRTAQKMSKAQFIKLGMKDTEEFFSVEWKYKDVCKHARLTCKAKKEIQTRAAMKMAYKALREMKIHKDNLDYHNFVKSYASFGKGFIKNRFSFKTILNLTRSAKDSAKNPAVMINFKISGTALPPYKKDIPIY
ncbi:hypothetical protein OAK75_08150 [Bacteriovoracales bacterium]|nr:hypothetical protein [Bacteriovoracales bacterium]